MNKVLVIIVGVFLTDCVATTYRPIVDLKSGFDYF